MDHISLFGDKTEKTLEDYLVREIEKYRWELQEYQPDQHYRRFRRGGDILDIWPTTLTIRFITGDNREHYHHDDIQELRDTLTKLDHVDA